MLTPSDSPFAHLTAYIKYLFIFPYSLPCCLWATVCLHLVFRGDHGRRCPSVWPWCPLDKYLPIGPTVALVAPLSASQPTHLKCPWLRLVKCKCERAFVWKFMICKSLPLKLGNSTPGYHREFSVTNFFNPRRDTDASPDSEQILQYEPVCGCIHMIWQ